LKKENQGRFIVFEGIDGSGNSTQIQQVARQLAADGYLVTTTCEPTDGPVGSLIRKILAGTVDMDQQTLAMLFAADRSDHLVNPETGICRARDQGRIVLCDRYYFSSYAYHARYMDMAWVIQMNGCNAGILRPDLTVFIDVDPEICLARIRARQTRLEMYEKIDILKQVRAHYFTAFDRLSDQEKVVIIDGNNAPDQVEKHILNRIRGILETKVNDEYQ
jgi:dTMP kinase